MHTDTTLTILGAGYVGLTTAALLSHADYTVYVVEPNKARLASIKAGKSFFFEDGLDPLISAAIKKGTLIPTDSYADSIPKSDIVFSCVGTPDNPDGSSNLTYVFDAANQAADHLTKDAIYVQKSTVPVGTGKKIRQLFKSKSVPAHYVSNPEFLREGTALYDTLCFDRVVVGGSHAKSLERIANLYKQLNAYRNHIAALADITIDESEGEYIFTNLQSAELIKVTANAFLATKISFANSIARLADVVHADINEVMDAVGADPRIGRAFLNAGRGYGGGCFPKDVSGLIASGLEHGVGLDIMEAVQAVNVSMPGYVVEQTIKTLGDIRGKKIAVLGLAFKANTSDTRRSPGIQIANLLATQSATVTAYDPQGAKEATSDLHDSVAIATSIFDTLVGADAVIIATAWQEFLKTDPADFAEALGGTLFVDAINQFSPPHIRSAGLTYIGIGRS